jgi:hypothetical protein
MEFYHPQENCLHMNSRAIRTNIPNAEEAVKHPFDSATRLEGVSKREQVENGDVQSIRR